MLFLHHFAVISGDLYRNGKLLLTWQDLIFSAGNLYFAGALIPTILGDEKPKLLTSLMTGFGLAAGSYAFLTLPVPLWLTGATQLIQSSAWFVLATQRIRFDYARKGEASRRMA